MAVDYRGRNGDRAVPGSCMPQYFEISEKQQ